VVACAVHGRSTMRSDYEFEDEEDEDEDEEYDAEECRRCGAQPDELQHPYSPHGNNNIHCPYCDTCPMEKPKAADRPVCKHQVLWGAGVFGTDEHEFSPLAGRFPGRKDVRDLLKVVQKLRDACQPKGLSYGDMYRIDSRIMSRLHGPPPKPGDWQLRDLYAEDFGYCVRAVHWLEEVDGVDCLWKANEAGGMTSGLESRCYSSDPKAYAEAFAARARDLLAEVEVLQRKVEEFRVESEPEGD